MIILIILIIAGIVVAGIWHLARSKPASRMASARETPAEQAHRTERARAEERARQERARQARARQEEQARRREEALRQEQRRQEAEALHADLVALELAARKLPAASPAAPRAGRRPAPGRPGQSDRDGGRAIARPDPAGPRRRRRWRRSGPRDPVVHRGPRPQGRGRGRCRATRPARFGATGAGAAADNALLALTGLPATLGAVKGALGTHLQDPAFSVAVMNAVGSTLDHARTTLLPDLDPEGGMHVGLFFDSAVAAAGQGPWGALRAGARWGGKEILHGGWRIWAGR